MHVVLIQNDQNTDYVIGLRIALVNRGHKVSVLSSDNKFNSVFGKKEGTDLEFKSPLDFSLYVHHWLTQEGPHVVEAPSSNYPLLMDQLAGGTPTVVRYISQSKPIDYNLSLRANLTRNSLEVMTLRGANRVIASTKSLIKTGIDRARILPVGIQRPEVLCRSYSNNLVRRGYVIYCDNLWIPVYKKEMATYSVELRPLYELNSLTDYSLFQELCGVGILSSQLDESKVLSIMATGCPVIHSHAGPDYADWPVFWVNQSAQDVFSQISAILKAQQNKVELSNDVSKFASNFFWPNLVDRYLEVYTEAIEHAWSIGRVRGW